MAVDFWASSHYQQWTFSKTEIIRMRAEDLKIYSEEEYAKFMIFWPNFIQNLVTDAAKQGHPVIRMQVIGTAVVFFKRFYLRRSFRDLDPFALCCVCVLLASKAEEHGQVSVTKLSQMVPVTLRKHYNAHYELKGPIPYDIEFILVETMDCCLIVFQPYTSLIAFVENIINEWGPEMYKGGDKEMYKGKEDKDKEKDKLTETMKAQCWKVVNDSFRTDCSLMYPPYVIAIASIVLGCTLMDKEEWITNWVGELTVDLTEIYECLKMLNDMYLQWRDFVEKEQVQGLIDKLPKINGEPPANFGGLGGSDSRPSSAVPPPSTAQVPPTSQASSSAPSTSTTTTAPSTSKKSGPSKP